MKLRQAFNAGRSMAVTLAIVAPLSTGNADFNGEDNTGARPFDPEGQGLILKEPDTQASLHVSGLQARFSDVYEDNMRIAVLDPDWFRLNAALNASEEGQFMSVPLLSSFVRDRHLIELEPAHAEEAVTALGDQAAKALPVSHQDGRICYVSGQVSNIDQEEQLKRMLGILPEVHGVIASVPLKPEIMSRYTLDVARKYTDYHEIGHCFDRWYLPAEIESGAFDLTMSEKVELRHKSEVYAESFATLLMAKDGHNAVSEIRADLRLAFLGLQGPITAKRVGREYLEHHAPYIYALHNAIRATQDIINGMGPETLQNLGYNDFAEIARDVSEQHSFDPQVGAHVLGYAPDQFWDVSRWDEIRHEIEHIAPRYELAVRIIEDIDRALANLFDFGAHGIEPMKINDVHFDMDGTADVIKRLNEEDQELRNERLPELVEGFYSALKVADRPSETLAPLYQQNVDRLRRDLESEARQTRKAAMEDLSLIGEAVKLSFQKILSESRQNPALHADRALDMHP